MEFYKPYPGNFSVFVGPDHYVSPREDTVTDPQNHITTLSLLSFLTFSVIRSPLISRCSTRLWRLHSFFKGFPCSRLFSPRIHLKTYRKNCSWFLGPWSVEIIILLLPDHQKLYWFLFSRRAKSNPQLATRAYKFLPWKKGLEIMSSFLKGAFHCEILVPLFFVAFTVLLGLKNVIL